MALLFACETDSGKIVDIPTRDSKFVVFSVLTDNESSKLYLNKSIGILENGDTSAPENTVLSFKDEDGLTVFESTNIDSGHFEIPANTFEQGKAYSFQVNHTDIEEANYQFMMPSEQTVLIDTVPSVLRATDVYLDENNGVDIQIRFQDNPDEKNYYQIDLRVKAYWVDSNFLEEWGIEGEIEDKENGFTYYNSWANSIDTIIDSVAYFSDEFELWFTEDELNTNPSLEHVNYSHYILKDDLFNGQSFSIEKQGFSSTVDSAELIVRFYKITEEIYLYYKSYQLYQETRDNPFAEPVQLYSNLENGFGVLLPRIKNEARFKFYN